MASTIEIVGFLFQRQDVYPEAQWSQSPQALGSVPPVPTVLLRMRRVNDYLMEFVPPLQRWACSLLLCKVRQVRYLLPLTGEKRISRTHLAIRSSEFSVRFFNPYDTVYHLLKCGKCRIVVIRILEFEERMARRNPVVDKLLNCRTCTLEIVL